MNICPNCGDRGDCLESRVEKFGRRRRYQCLDCNWRWTSYEVYDDVMYEYKKWKRQAQYRQAQLQQMSKALEKLKAEEMSCD